jgi:hypothetical protein
VVLGSLKGVTEKEVRVDAELKKAEKVYNPVISVITRLKRL